MGRGGAARGCFRNQRGRGVRATLYTLLHTRTLTHAYAHPTCNLADMTSPTSPALLLTHAYTQVRARGAVGGSVRPRFHRPGA